MISLQQHRPAARAFFPPVGSFSVSLAFRNDASTKYSEHALYYREELREEEKRERGIRVLRERDISNAVESRDVLAEMKNRDKKLYSRRK